MINGLSIYRRALSADEIQTVYARESQGSNLALPAASEGWTESWMQ